MNLFNLFAKIILDTGEYEEGLKGATEKSSAFGDALKKGLANTAKIAAAGIAATATAIGALGKASVESYAQYEQLTGGVETLFKTSSSLVMSYADVAYKTAGLSANQYMETVTSFSASLLQSLGGDTDAAAQKANQAIIDMADNANKMGSSMESIQNAYQGFAKQNYTMLDNLKLGYGGTAQEMYRLMEDAAKLNEEFANTANFSIDTKGHLEANYADIVEAIHIVQTEMGITGTTAEEASTTIQGSLSSMSAAWQNLITGIADPTQDFDRLIMRFVDSVGTVARNLVPRISMVLNGVGELVAGLAPVIAEEVPVILEELLPTLLEGAATLMASLVEALPDILSVLSDLLPMLIETILTMLPAWYQAGIDILMAFVQSISNNLSTLIPAAVNMILQIINTLTDPAQLESMLNAALTLVLELTKGLVQAVPRLIDGALALVMNLIDFILNEENLNSLIQAALEIILTITEGLVTAIPQLVDATVQIIEKLCDFLLDPQNIRMLLDMAFSIVVAIVSGLGKASIELVKGAAKLIGTLIDRFTSTNWGEVGRTIVNGIWEGIKATWNAVVEWVSDAVDSVMNFISGGKSEAEKALEGDDDIPISDDTSTSRGSGRRGTSVTVNQTIYSEAKTAADLMEEAKYQQDKGVYLGV